MNKLDTKANITIKPKTEKMHEQTGSLSPEHINKHVEVISSRKTHPMQMMSQLPGEKDNKSGSKRGYLLHEKSWGGDRVLKRMREKLQQNSGYNGSKKGKLKSFSSSGRNAHLEAEKGRTLLPQEARYQYV